MVVQTVDAFGSEVRELKRSTLVNRLTLLESQSDAVFDRLTRLAARSTESPMVIFTLLDDQHHFFKSQVGIRNPWNAVRRVSHKDQPYHLVIDKNDLVTVRDIRDFSRLQGHLTVAQFSFVAFAGIPIRLHDGSVLGTLCLLDHMPRVWTDDEIQTLRDVGAAIATEVELRKKSADLDEVRSRLTEYTSTLEARNEELASFASTVAHDLKTPLQSIIGFAEILRVDFSYLSQAEIEKFLMRIEHSGRKIATIVNELLLLGQIRQVDVEVTPIDMKQIVIEAQNRLSLSIEASKAEIILPEQWPMACGYAPWIEEVWVNYLSNAIKYGGNPPRLELGAEQAPDGFINFWVKDNGVGLTLEQQNKLFKPFSRLHTGTFEGHGLGLSIVQRIIEKLGGNVGVSSVPAGGSTFSFRLPVSSNSGNKA